MPIKLVASSKRKLKKAMRKVIYFPISSALFKLYASLLLKIGADREHNLSNPSTKRILISHLYCNLGDLILTIPLIDSLNRHFSSYAVDIAIDIKLAEFCKSIPGISNVYAFEPGISKLAVINPYLHVISQIKLYWRYLRHVRHSMCIVPRWGEDPFRSQYLAYLSSAPKRYGYSASVDRGDISRDRLLSQCSIAGSHEHEIVRELRLLQRVGVVSESVSDSIVNQPSATLQLLVSRNEKVPLSTIIPGLPFELSAGNYAVVAPGSTQRKRNWPAYKFSDAILRLQERYAINFLLTGGPGEVELCNAVSDACGGTAVSIAGRTQLTGLMLLLKNAAIVIGNDSGTGHLSGALGVPTIAISSFPRSCPQEHANSPQRFRPMGPRVSVIQPAQPLPPCIHYCECTEAHCITQVSVEDVVAAAEGYLDKCITPMSVRAHLDS